MKELLLDKQNQIPIMMPVVYDKFLKSNCPLSSKPTLNITLKQFK